MTTAASQTQSVLVISTRHLPLNLVAYLADLCPSLNVSPLEDTRWSVVVPKRTGRDVPDEVAEALDLARNLGCARVEFDAFAEVLDEDELPTYHDELAQVA